MSHVNGALIDMTGSESLVSYENDLIVYFDTFGNPHYIEKSHDVVAVKILEEILLVVSQYQDYFIVSNYRKTDIERGVVNQVKFDGLYNSVNYIKSELLISYYSTSDNISRIDRIYDDLTITTIVEKKGNYILYPIYYSDSEFVHSLNQNVEKSKAVIKVVDSEGNAYRHQFKGRINKTVLIKDKIYFMTGGDNPSVYTFDIDRETLELYSASVDIGAGLYNIQNNLVIINKKEIVVNNKSIKSLNESKIDTKYH